jgi:hypothetical protein
MDGDSESVPANVEMSSRLDVKEIDCIHRSHFPVHVLKSSFNLMCLCLTVGWSPLDLEHSAAASESVCLLLVLLVTFAFFQLLVSLCLSMRPWPSAQRWLVPCTDLNEDRDRCISFIYFCVPLSLSGVSAALHSSHCISEWILLHSSHRGCSVKSAASVRLLRNSSAPTSPPLCVSRPVQCGSPCCPAPPL